MNVEIRLIPCDLDPKAHTSHRKGECPTLAQTPSTPSSHCPNFISVYTSLTSKPLFLPFNQPLCPYASWSTKVTQEGRKKHEVTATPGKGFTQSS